MVTRPHMPLTALWRRSPLQVRPREASNHQHYLRSVRSDGSRVAEKWRDEDELSSDIRVE